MAALMDEVECQDASTRGTRGQLLICRIRYDTPCRHSYSRARAYRRARQEARWDTRLAPRRRARARARAAGGFRCQLTRLDNPSARGAGGPARPHRRVGRRLLPRPRLARPGHAPAHVPIARPCSRPHRTPSRLSPAPSAHHRPLPRSLSAPPAPAPPLCCGPEPAFRSRDAPRASRASRRSPGPSRRHRPSRRAWPAASPRQRRPSGPCA